MDHLLPGGRGKRFLARAGILLPVLVLAACARDPAGELGRLVPELPREFALHLVRSDDATLRGFCREAGRSATGKAMHAFTKSYPLDSAEALAERVRMLRPYHERLLDAYADVFGYHEFQERGLAQMNAPPDRRLEMYRLNSKQARLLGEHDLPYEDRLRRLRALRVEVESIGYPISPVFVYHRFAETYNEMKDERRVEWWNRALEEARRAGLHHITCQILGEIGAYRGEISDHEGKLEHYRQALDLAVEHGIIDQVCRLAEFLGNHYLARGEKRRAAEVHRRVESLIASEGGRAEEFRLVDARLRFLAGLGCWEEVERLLPRAAAALARGREVWHDTPFETLRQRLECLRGRCLMARGEVEAADRIFARLEPESRALPAIQEYPKVVIFWVEGLTGNGWWTRAAEVGETALAYARENKLRSEESRLSARMARTHFELGDLGRSRERLREFDALVAERDSAAAGRRDRGEGAPPSEDELWLDGLRVRLRLAEGDTAAALGVARLGLDRLGRYLHHADASAERYLTVSKYGEIFDVLHELIAHDPGAGYGMEMRRRTALSAGDGNREDGMRELSACVDLVKSVLDAGRGEARGQAPGAGAMAPGTVHLVYRTGGEATVCWVRTAGGILRRVIPVSRDDLAGKVGEALESILSGRNPIGDVRRSPGGQAGRELRVLGRLLLPVDLIEGPPSRTPGTLYVTADGPVSQVPFAALDLGEKAYEPLLLRFDVVFVRRLRDGPKKSPHRGVLVVADPVPSDEIRRRHPGLRPLLHARDEIAELRRSFPEMLLLTGREAAKFRVLEEMPGAAMVYFASHVARDPELPYLDFIPLSPDSGSGPDGSGILDVSDILDLDLSGCGLVVLSACASGRPYLGRGTVGASLADAFLDAGAGAVIQTGWDVRDDHAAEFMRRFVRLVQAEGVAPVAALNEVRRRRFVEAGPLSSPAQWAAYRIAVGSLEE